MAAIPPNKYRDIIEQVHVYNSKVLLERKLRMPYIDGQTGVAQQDCHLWMSRVARCAPLRDGQVCSYPSRRWLVRRRPDFDNIYKPAPKKEITEIAEPPVVEPAAEAVPVQPPKEEVVPNQGLEDEVKVELEMHPPETHEYQDEGGLSDFSDSDDEFKPGKKRKRPSVRKGRKNILALKLADKIRAISKEEINKMDFEDRKKPYVCEICSKRYKNQQGLRYHYQHFNHDEDEDDMYMGSEVQVAPGQFESHPEMRMEHAKKSKGANAYCDFCLGDNLRNKKTGQQEELISCSDCGRSGHPTCLQFTEKLTQEVKKYRWQCIECKSCCLCGTSDNDDQLLFCDECDRGYHMYCLTPRITEPPEGHWCCKLCTDRIAKEKEEEEQKSELHSTNGLAADTSKTTGGSNGLASESSVALLDSTNEESQKEENPSSENEGENGAAESSPKPATSPSITADNESSQNGKIRKEREEEDSLK